MRLSLSSLNTDVFLIIVSYLDGASRIRLSHVGFKESSLRVFFNRNCQSFRRALRLSNEARAFWSYAHTPTIHYTSIAESLADYSKTDHKRAALRFWKNLTNQSSKTPRLVRNIMLPFQRHRLHAYVPGTRWFFFVEQRSIAEGPSQEIRCLDLSTARPISGSISISSAIISISAEQGSKPNEVTLICGRRQAIDPNLSQGGTHASSGTEERAPHRLVPLLVPRVKSRNVGITDLETYSTAA